MAVTRGLWCAAVGVVLLGCVTPRTEVIVSVDTDIATLDQITIDVTDPRGNTRSSSASLGAGQPPLPRTLGVAWTGGSLGPFVVHVAGFEAGAQRIERNADFTFQRGRTLVLPMDLLGRCRGVTCPGGETCGDSGCRSTTIAPAELAPWSGTITGSDAGMRSDGGCGTETCNGADDDCDGSVDEDFDFGSDAMNCGGCGDVCSFPNGMGRCQGGACIVTGCDPGFADCNRRSSDGCESDPQTDSANCGSCGRRCRGTNDTCCAGTCRSAC